MNIQNREENNVVQIDFRNFSLPDNPNETMNEAMERLARAAAKMEESLKVQKTGINKFHEDGTALDGLFKKMKSNLQRFQTELGKVNISRTRKNAFRLQQIANDWEKNST
jgi:hypothetical protein